MKKKKEAERDINNRRIYPIMKTQVKTQKGTI